MINKKIYHSENNFRIVMLHGWLETHEVFNPLIGKLKKFECVLFDLPGFGFSPAPKVKIGSEGYAKMIIEEIKKLDEKPTIIVGHSFGTRVAMHMTAMNDTGIIGLILLSASGLIRQRNIFFKYRSFMVRIANCFWSTHSTNLLKKIFLNAALGKEYRGSGGMKKIMEQIFIEDLTALMKKIQCRVTLFYGQNDKHTTPRLAKKINRIISSSQLHILPEIGHWDIIKSAKSEILASIMEYMK